MRVPPLRRLCWLLFAALVPGFALAADAGIEVGAVRFRSVRPAAGNGAPWLEADVALDVSPPSGRMLSRVRVELTLGFELPATAGAGGGERRVEYFRAAAECVALEAGRSDVRFYLPPELVKRDQLHSDPKFWSVALAVGAHPVAAVGRAGFSLALADEAARRTFHAAAAAAAPANDGLLQPQYMTPFALEYPRATPSFVRREPPAFAAPAPPR